MQNSREGRWGAGQGRTPEPLNLQHTLRLAVMLFNTAAVQKATSHTYRLCLLSVTHLASLRQHSLHVDLEWHDLFKADDILSLQPFENNSHLVALHYTDGVLDKLDSHRPFSMGVQYDYLSSLNSLMAWVCREAAPFSSLVLGTNSSLTLTFSRSPSSGAVFKAPCHVIPHTDTSLCTFTTEQHRSSITSRHCQLS